MDAESLEKSIKNADTDVDKQAEINLKEPDADTEDLKDLDSESKDEIKKMREKRIKRQKIFSDMTNDDKKHNNNLNSQSLLDATSHNNNLNSQSLLDATSQVNELLNVGENAGKRQSNLETIMRAHCQRYPEQCAQ